MRQRRLLAIVWPSRLKRVLQRLFDEGEFFGDYGVRAVSRYHRERPYTMTVGDADYAVRYEPAESSSGLFGGNSNWRGPVWFPINYLLIEALQKYHHYAGDALTVEVPSGSGNAVSLWDASSAIAHRLIAIFARDERGRRPVFGGNERMQADPYWRDHVLFYEYFHGDNGAGVGASHQTGWTALVAKLLQQCAEHCGEHVEPLQALVTAALARSE